MGLYEGIKDVAKIVQQADNLELYKSLLDLSAQALDMQAEIAALQRENEQLKSEVSKKKSIIRHKGLFVTVEGEKPGIVYCSSCYGKDNKLIQMFEFDEKYYGCPICNTDTYKEME